MERPIVEGLRDLAQTVQRGENLGSHYPVSKWVVCQACHGEGGKMNMAAWKEHWVDCPVCGGEGVKRVSHNPKQD